MKVFVVACALLSVAVAQTVPSTILQDCFEKDSIACVQQTVYRRAREFFDQPSIQLFGGVSFAKSNERTSKSLETSQVEQAASVQEREVALEDYLVGRAKNFFTERKLTWDVATTGRAISNAIPDEVKESVRELVVEGRTKKKILKKLIPILGLLKLKLAGLAVLAVAGIGLLAKKALFTSFIAIAIAGASFLSSVVAKLIGLGSGLAGGLGSKAGGLGGLAGGLGGLLGGGNSNSNGAYSNANVEEIIAYNTGPAYSSGGSGWSSNSNGWSNNGWDEHGSHSQPIGAVLAYNGHHPKTQ